MAKKWFQRIFPTSPAPAPALALTNPNNENLGSSSVPNSASPSRSKPPSTQPATSFPFPPQRTSWDSAFESDSSLGSSTTMPITIPVCKEPRTCHPACTESGCSSSFDVSSPGPLSNTESQTSISGIFMADMEEQMEQYRRAVSQAEDELKCIICLNHPRAILLSPCHHVVTCETCTVQLPTSSSITGGYRSCPVCRRTFTKTTKIFFS